MINSCLFIGNSGLASAPRGVSRGWPPLQRRRVLRRENQRAQRIAARFLEPCVDEGAQLLRQKRAVPVWIVHFGGVSSLIDARVAARRNAEERYVRRDDRNILPVG